MKETRKVPAGCKPLPEDKPWLAFLGKCRDLGESCLWLFAATKGGGNWREGYRGDDSREFYYAIDTRNLEAQRLFSATCEAHNKEETKPLLGSDPAITTVVKASVARLMNETRAINIANGWDVHNPEDWPQDQPPAKPDKLMRNLALIHSEVSEATEAVRKNDRANFEEELADTVIRCFDVSSGLGVDLADAIISKLEKNRTRGFKHGGKLC